MHFGIQGIWHYFNYQETRGLESCLSGKKTNGSVKKKKKENLSISSAHQTIPMAAFQNRMLISPLSPGLQQRQKHLDIPF